MPELKRIPPVDVAAAYGKIAPLGYEPTQREFVESHYCCGLSAYAAANLPEGPVETLASIRRLGGAAGESPGDWLQDHLGLPEGYVDGFVAGFDGFVAGFDGCSLVGVVRGLSDDPDAVEAATAGYGDGREAAKLVGLVV